MRTKLPFVSASIVVALAITGLGGLAAGTAQAAPARATLRGSALTWTKSERAVGAAARTHTVSVRVYLAGQNPAALDAAATAVITPGSASFRHFITPAQYDAKYAPTTAQVASVEQWLRASGMHVQSVAAGNRYVAATGQTAAAERAFGTTLRTYKHAGATVTAPDTDASVPAELAGVVLGVTGLDDQPHFQKAGVQGNPPPPAASLRATPCSQYYGQLTATVGPDGTAIPPYKGSARPWATCGYLPQQFNAAYGGAADHLTGKGTTIGISLWYASPTQPADENRFDKTHGFPGLAPGQFETVMPNKPFHRGNVCGEAQEEQAIDMTSIHDVAPAAKIKYYAAASCFDDDILDTLAQIVDDNRVSVISNSWGGQLSAETSDAILAYEQIFKQAAMQGQAFFFSSGDNGDWTATVGHTDYDFPASDPWVTAIGGTTMNLDANSNTVWEAGWGYNVVALQDGKWVNTGFGGGAGGGIAPAWGRPDYQKGVVHAIAQGRAYPDIAADADNATGIRTGYVQAFPSGLHYAETRWGGTSLASPLMAGEQALAEQTLGGRIGFANPLIYALQRSRSSALNDITGAHDSEALVRSDFANLHSPSNGFVFSVRTIDDDSSLHTHAGWDDVTGVGTPNAGYPAAMAAAAAG
jgi:subtilase family serine protease